MVYLWVPVHSLCEISNMHYMNKNQIKGYYSDDISPFILLFLLHASVTKLRNWITLLHKVKVGNPTTLQLKEYKYGKSVFKYRRQTFQSPFLVYFNSKICGRKSRFVEFITYSQINLHYYVGSLSYYYLSAKLNNDTLNCNWFSILFPLCDEQSYFHLVSLVIHFCVILRNMCGCSCNILLFLSSI